MTKVGGETGQAGASRPYRNAVYVHEVLVEGEQARRMGLDALAGTVAGRFRTPLRGRAPEIETVARAFTSVEAGQTELTALVGDPGIGKTRLVQHALRMAEERGWSTLVVAPGPDSATAPLGALLEAAQSTTARLVTDKEVSGLLHGPAPQYWLTRLLADRLESLAAEDRLLVIVDDLQWLDAGSLGVITALLRDLQGIPVYWMFASRTGNYGPSHARFMAVVASVGTVIDILPIDAQAVSAVARDRLGAAPGPSLAHAMERAGGYPLILLELLQGMEEEGLLRVNRGVIDLERDVVPARFGTSARERLSRVSKDALQVAQVGSLYGREFPVAGVFGVLGRTAAEGAPAVQELIDLGFIIDTGTSLCFRHDTVHSAAQDSLPPSLRRVMAREVLSRRLQAGERPAALARTIASVADSEDEDSIELLVVAAIQLAETDAQGASELAVLASRLAGGQPWHTERVAALVPILLTGAPVHEAMEISRALMPALSAESRARVGLAVARRLTEYDFDAAIAEATEALSIPGVSDATRVQLLAVRALNHANIADSTGLRTQLDLARAAADDERDGIALATLDASESVLFFYQGQFEAAERLQRRAEQRIADSGASPNLWLPEGLWLAFMRNTLGDGEGSLRLVEAGLAEARSGRHVTAEAYWLMVRVRALYDLGRLEDARVLAEAVLDLAAQLGLGDFANATAGIVLHRVGMHTGDIHLREQTRPLVDELAGGTTLTRTGRWSLALESLDGGRPEDAHAFSNLAWSSIEEPIPSMTTPSDFGDHITLAIICRAVDDEPSLARIADVTAMRAARHPANHLVQAVSAATRGIRDGSSADLYEAVEHLRQVERPLVLARVLESVGQLDVGQEGPLREALAIYDDLGAARDADRVRHTLRQRGVRTRLVASDQNDTRSGLTPREFQVAERIAAGRTTQQIADDLLLSPHTVVAHIRHIFTKWRVNTRREVKEQMLAARPRPEQSS
ncbi:AAA family ATPase [Microbacterium trichothecenolyticum]|nr:AAA family ATPase [Microbacterium trichothecenolyticum]